MQETYYLGIDVSKGYADFIMVDDKKQAIDSGFQLDDTFAGRNCLHERLNHFLNGHPGAIIFAGVESTGGYENNWYEYLHGLQDQLNIKVARLNPLGVNANSKANLNRNTTDAISARNIAEFIIAHPEKVDFSAPDPLASLRKQWTFVKMLTKQCTQLQNELESLLYSANPELLRYCQHGTPDWVYLVLLKYPTAAALSNAHLSALNKIPYLKEDRAREILANARKSVASAVDYIIAQLIIDTVKQIRGLKAAIQSQLNLMTEACEIPEVELLKSFIGIGDYSAMGLILSIGSIERFPSVKKMAAFFGLHPELKESGDGVVKPRMSKRGRKEPRQILYMVTLVAIQKNPLIKEIYERLLARGMEKMAAIGYCMHKIMRIVYGMLKHKRAFDPEIDRRNREKSSVKEKSQAAPQDKKRRYQDYDPQAPVSQRQAKKRKERKESQKVTNHQSGINATVPVTV